MTDVVRLPNWSDAAAMALADIKTIPELDQLFMRYVWITNGEVETAKTLAAVPNIISRSTVIHRPFPLVKDKLILLRMDIRLYAPRTADLREWVAQWESLRNEPKFSLLITKDSLAGLVFAEGEVVPTVRQTVQKKRRVVNKGKAKVITEEVDEEIPITQAKNIDLARFVGKHVDPATWSELIQRTGSEAPIISHGYFVTRVLATIQDAGLFKELYGGLYYEFAGIKENATGKGTDEDLWFQDHIGLGDIANGLTARKIYDKLRSDKRIAAWKSNVTGKVRAVDYGHGPQGEDSGHWAVSHDGRDQDIDNSRHPIFSLLNQKDFAREAIWARATGLHGYALFNGQGKLQREVPPDVAINREIPSPHTARLQAGIGCISCHETQAEGWQPLKNDVKELLGDILGDVSKVDKSIADTLDQIYGRYGGNPTKWLNRGRDDYSAAMLKATGPFAGQGEQKAIVKTVGAKLWDIWIEYNYKPVDAQLAMRELGFECPKEKAVALFNSLLPPVENLGVGVPEDVRILALKKGQSINRTDFDLVYSFVAARGQKTMASQPKGR